MPVKGASAYPGVIITTCTSHLGTVERVTRLLSHSTTFVSIIHSLTERRGTTRPYSQRGGWHYWQRPSGENATGAKRGRQAPGEQREEREPGRCKSQGRPGHLTEMEGFFRAAHEFLGAKKQRKQAAPRKCALAHSGFRARWLSAFVCSLGVAYTCSFVCWLASLFFKLRSLL